MGSSLCSGAVYVPPWFAYGLARGPELLLDNGRLLPRERLVFVRDLAQVDPVLQHLVQSSPREDNPSRGSSISADSLLAPNSLLFEVRAQLRQTAKLQIRAKDLSAASYGSS
jgi:hypothetical protein